MNLVEKLGPFILVSKDEKGNYIIPKNYSSVEKVGEIQEITHLMFCGMMPPEIIHKIDGLGFLDKFDVNAVYIDSKRFERLDEYNGRTYFQPLKLNK
ncbi:MAG: hypothetical protein ABIH79_02975 [archaeon]